VRVGSPGCARRGGTSDVVDDPDIFDDPEPQTHVGTSPGRQGRFSDHETDGPDGEDAEDEEGTQEEAGTHPARDDHDGDHHDRDRDHHDGDHDGADHRGHHGATDRRSTAGGARHRPWWPGHAGADRTR
jgi:hypothetical protein